MVVVEVVVVVMIMMMVMVVVVVMVFEKNNHTLTFKSLVLPQIFLFELQVGKAPSC
jgi:hypothetical protein